MIYFVDENGVPITDSSLVYDKAYFTYAEADKDMWWVKKSYGKLGRIQIMELTVSEMRPYSDKVYEPAKPRPVEMVDTFDDISALWS
jgi:hypothetical protein